MTMIQRTKTGLSALLMLLLAATAFANENNPTPRPDAYPLDTCVVSGMKLGSMGNPYVHHTDDGTEVRFCCKGCLPTFEKNREKYLKKIEAAQDHGNGHKDHKH